MQYKNCGFYVTRVPLLPIDDYFRMFECNNDKELRVRLVNAFKLPVLQEALAVSSWESFRALERIEKTDDNRMLQQATSTLLKYYIRLTTRPTPYGVLAGVSVGLFGNDMRILVDTIQNHSKRTRVDMNWLYNIICDIESIESIRMQLKVRFNDYIYKRGNRLEQPWKSCLNLNDSRNKTGTSIRYTPRVKDVEQLAEGYIEYAELFEKMCSQNLHVPKEVIKGFLDNLFENEYLISELRPPMVNTEALSYVIEILGKIEDNKEANEFREELLGIRKRIQGYDLSELGDGIESFCSLISRMQERRKSRNCLQVDLKTKVIENNLSKELASDLEGFVDAMLRISPENKRPDEYMNYIDLFLEKYGYEAEVPVLDLLDKDRGLGALSYYTYDQSNTRPLKRRKTEKETRLDEILNYKCLLAIKSGGKIVEITDEDIDYISGNGSEFERPYNDKYIPSFELFLMVNYNSVSSSGKAEYTATIAPAIASFGVGKSLGRFRDMFSEQETKLLRDTIDEEKELLSEYALMEISELPTKGRLSNVAMNESDFDYQMTLATNCTKGMERIKIDDLYISLDAARHDFIIRSKSLNKKILAISTSMLNPAMGSNVCRFLKEVSSRYYYNPITSIEQIVHNDDVYSPRIMYKNIIIKPETWMITKIGLGWSDEKEESFKECIKQFGRKWNLPRYVLLTESDNRLLLDVDNPMHLHEIFLALKKQGIKSIKLTEATYINGGHIVHDENGADYVAEYVVPFIAKGNSSQKLNHQQMAIPTISQVKRNAMEINRENLTIFPGKGGWLYFKLYGTLKRRNEILQRIGEKMEEFILEQRIKKYFFIRYADPDSHIRLRIEALEKKGTFELFDDVMSFLIDLKNEGLLSSIGVDTYKREIERYGGQKLIEYAEEYFFQDSRLALGILQMNEPAEKLESLGITYIILIFLTLGLSLETIEEELSKWIDRKENRDFYRKNRKDCIKAANLAIAIYSSDESSDCVKNKFLEKHRQHIVTYFQQVDAIDKVGELTNYKLDIAKSIIHMFFNRLVGDNRWERKVYTLSRHAIHDLNSAKK